MDIAVLFFLTSGLFLGWALGGNDAANVFGTAVGTRMVSFATAAAVCTVFVILGAVISGAGAAGTLGKLGSVNALGGSFMAALSAALAVYMMTKAGLPVSTTQAIVGGIIAWSLFSESLTDIGSLIKILSTWIICPVLAAGISVLLFKAVTGILKRTRIHLLRSDAYTRLGLIVAGAFGAYSLGANNIANVMGVFVPSSPFTDFKVFGLFTLTSIQQLFLLGGIAIGVGVLTYSKRVMMTVGSGILPLSPVAAWVVVMAHSIVLFLFASQGLESFLASRGLPTIPLVPVSSSQAIVGAVFGIGLLKGGRGIQWRVLGRIGAGWVVTPFIAGVVCFVGLFIMQNVFDQEVYRETPYALSDPVLERLERAGVDTKAIGHLKGETFSSAVRLKEAIGNRMDDPASTLEFARIDEMTISEIGVAALRTGRLTGPQILAVAGLMGRTFPHRWMLAEELARWSGAWRPLEDTKVNKAFNRELAGRLDLLYRTFRFPL